jgi:hypothetical protein
MAYFNLETELFTLRAPASAAASSLPISLLSRLQYSTVVIKERYFPESYHMTYFSFVTALFPSRAPASAAAPSLPMLL